MSSIPAKQVRSRPERFALRVVKGGFQPADASTHARLKARTYRVGDLVFAEFRKPRNPQFHRLAHQLGILFVENIEAFEHLNPHACLKRLQLECGVGCDEIAIPIGAIWSRVTDWVGANIGAPFATVLSAAVDALGGRGALITILIPRSLSYESMEEGEFKQVVAAICSHVSTTYWPSLTPEQIEAMAGAMVDHA